MPTGSCFCGNIKVEWTGEPVGTALCHCGDCRKISGGTHSTNILIPSAQFQVVSGTPKQISKKADSGKEITSNFCPDCGTTLFRYGDSFGGIDGIRIVKAGIADDIETLNTQAKPKNELFAPTRIAWVAQVSGTNDVEGMPPA